MTGSSSGVRIGRLACAAVLGAYGLLAGNALSAKEAAAATALPETAGIAPASHGSVELSAAERPAQVAVAAPVGHVSFGRDEAIIGKMVYSAHDQVGGTASLVSFSYKPFPVAAPSSGPLPSAEWLARYRMTSGFGYRRDPFGGGGEFHPGVDLAASAGSPVRATADGVVGRAGWNGGYGQMVALEQGNGIETRYGHMSQLAVVPGQQVRRGEVIGYVGSTGRSTGAHLHYEVRVNGRPVDPLP